MTMFNTNSSEETSQLGAKLARQLHGGEVICLSGPLGSGKTTFVTGLIRHFLPEARVLSPTFTLVRQYHTKHLTITHLYHLDLYRLNEGAQVAGLGLEEYLNRPDTVVLIEWPEKIKKLSVNNRIEISISITDDTKRVITVKK